MCIALPHQLLTLNITITTPDRRSAHPYATTTLALSKQVFRVARHAMNATNADEPTGVAIVLCLEVVAGALALLCGSIVVLAVLWAPELRNACNYAIANLAISESLCGLIALLKATINFTNIQANSIPCILLLSMSVFAQTVALLNALALAAHRYSAFLRPHTYASTTAGLFALLGACPWLLAAVGTGLAFAEPMQKQSTALKHTCNPWLYIAIAYRSCYCALYALFCAATVALYARIIRRGRKDIVRLRALRPQHTDVVPQSLHHRLLNKKHRFVKILTAVLIAFLMGHCAQPFAIALSLVCNVDQAQIILEFATLILLVQSVTNCVGQVYCSQEYRNTIVSVCCCQQDASRIKSENYEVASTMSGRHRSLRNSTTAETSFSSFSPA